MDIKDKSKIGGKKLKRLEAAVKKSMSVLSGFRKKRYDRIAARIGNGYSDDDKAGNTPINLLALASTVYLRNLVGGTPRIMTNARNRDLDPAADDLEQAGNVLLDKIDFISTLRRCVSEGFFGAGIIKVGLNKTGTVEIGGFLHDVGQPFVSNVSLDDFVFDTNASTWEEITFCGNYYRMAKEDVSQCGWSNVPKDIQTDEKSYIVADGGDEKVEALSGFQAASNEEYTDHVQLLDLWLPREKLFITLAVGGDSWTVLNEIEWEGPDRGPYHLLYLDEVPGNIMPMPPAAAWLDLHRLANMIFTKLGDQAQRLKSHLVFPRGGEGDAEAIESAGDGKGISLDSPDKVHEVRYGGPDQVLMAFFIQVKDIFSWIAGNLDTMGGLSAMADTLGQESILDSNTSKIIDDMRDRIVKWTQGIVQDLLWYLWYDPFIELPIVKRVAGTDISVQSTFSADSREGDFLDYNIEIDSYSLRYRTPSGQLQKIQMLVQNFVIPLTPLMQQSGISFRWDEFFKLAGEYADVPEFARLITYADEQMQEAAQRGIVGTPPQKAANTTRTYNRVSQSTGGTRTGRDQVMMQQLLGSAGQNKSIQAA